MYYPAGQMVDYPERFIIQEIIREKILYLTKEEVPHSIAIVVEKITKNRGTLVINAMIVVEKDSQKGIIIGKKGNMISQIGKMARDELEMILGNKVYLELFVRVEKDWRNKMHKLTEYGYFEVEDLDNEI